MISNPKHGWCNFSLGTFNGNPSYLTNVPVDLLQAFIDLHTKGCGCAWCDEEGTEFTFVVTPYLMFIIEEKDRPILYDFSDVRVDKVQEELIKDIQSNITAWSEFITDDNSDEVKKNFRAIINKIVELQGLNKKS